MNVRKVLRWRRLVALGATALLIGCDAGGGTQSLAAEEPAGAPAANATVVNVADAGVADPALVPQTPAWLRDDAAELLAWHTWWAEGFELSGDWAKAEPHRAAILAWWTAERGAAYWRTIDARVALDDVRLLRDLTADQRSGLKGAHMWLAKGKHEEVVEDLWSTQTSDAGSAYYVFKENFQVKHPFLLACWRWEADFHRRAGQPISERNARAMAVRDCAELFGKEHPTYLRAIEALALISDFAEAEPLRVEALALSRRLFGEESLQAADALDELAALYLDNLDLTRGELAARQALALRQKLQGKEHGGVVESLANLARAVRLKGDLRSATELAEDALRIAEAGRLAKSESLVAMQVELARLYEMQGRFAEALEFHEQAIATQLETFGEVSREYFFALDGLAELQLTAGNYDEAARNYQKLGYLDDKVFGPRHQLWWLAEAKELYAEALKPHSQRLQQRLHPIGEQIYSNALPGPGSIEFSTEETKATSACIIGLIYQMRGSDGLARRMFDVALPHLIKVSDQYAMAQTERDQLAYARQIRVYIDAYLSSALERPHEAEPVYRVVLPIKGATFMRQRAARGTAESEELRPLFENYQRAVTEWSTLVQSASADGQRLEELRLKKDEFEAELSRRSRTFQDLNSADAYDRLIAALSEGTVLVDFVEFERCDNADPLQDGRATWTPWLAAFVIVPGQEPQLVDLGTRIELDAAIDAWRETYGGSAKGLAAGQFLRERLWAPLESHLAGAETVVIAPDGSLGRVPFAALPGRAPGSYLIEDYRLALAPVPRLIPALMDSAKIAADADGGPTALLVGGVDYNAGGAAQGAPGADEDVGAWVELPGAAAEVTAIKEMYESATELATHVTTLTQGNATEAAFRAAAPNARILHLATHGYFAGDELQSALATRGQDRSNPGRLLSEHLREAAGYSPGQLSGLVMASANRRTSSSTEDGILTADELQALSLGGVDLAVLSACQTGLGQSAGGEGLIGIQRALQIAGVRSTIATLWKVDDAMTQQLMQAFYRNVLEGKQSYLDALRNAQIDLLRELRNAGVAAAEKRGGDPTPDEGETVLGPAYYWAAFTYSGDWR